MQTIALASLETVVGGAPQGFLTREQFQAGGRNLAEAGTIGAGAALGTMGGMGGAAAGAAGAELLNRTGVPGSFGEWAGGKVYDAISKPPAFDPSAAAQP